MYDTVLQVLQDPRNAWIGMGPMAMATRAPGWGAEVLRRYKLMGGTPETLDKVLRNRNAHVYDRHGVVKSFRQATDIAAPPNPVLSQEAKMYKAGKMYENIIPSHTQAGSRTLGEISQTREKIVDAKQRRGLSVPKLDYIESGMKGNAAYNALSRQVARMLDDERGSWSPFGWGQDPRTVSAANRLAAMDGGYKPLTGQSHYSSTTQGLSSDPVSWANLLDKRWGTYEAAVKGGIQDGLSPEQATDVARQLNFQPPGFDQVMQLRNESRNYGRLPDDPRRN